MKRLENNQLHTLLGKPTAAKASGLAFSLATVVPSLVAIAVFLLLAICGISIDESAAQKDWYLYLNFLLPQIGFLVVFFVFFRYKQTPVLSAIKKQKCAGRYFVFALLAQIVLFLLAEVNTLFLEFLGRFGYQDSGIQLPSMDGLGFVGVLLAIAVLPAMMEEIFFRGVLLSGLRSFGKWGAVLVCGVMFSLYHQNPAQTIYQFCCGAVYALIALRAGSVLPTMVAHFCNNALILILTKCGVTSFPLPVLLIVAGVAAISIILLSLWLFVWEKHSGEEVQTEEEEKGEKKHFFIYAAFGLCVCVITWVTVLFTGM